jgi:hypothetical protein
VVRPLLCTETFTPCIFIPILGTCFCAFQLNLGAFCLQFVDVGLNVDTLKFNWVTKIGIFRISGINLSHLGADLSILGAKKPLQGCQIPLKKIQKKKKNLLLLIWAYFFWVLIWAYCQF